MKKVVDCLEKYYKEKNYNCAESVFCAALEAWEVDMPKETVKAIAGFGGGMGCGNVCGGVTGGCAALSCRFVEGIGGHTSPGLPEKVSSYIRKVQETYGSELCSQLKEKFFVEGEDRCYATICKLAVLLDQVCEEE